MKFNVSGSLTKLNIKDLRENITYLFSVSARTAIGQGEKMDKNVTVGPQPGKYMYMYCNQFYFQDWYLRTLNRYLFSRFRININEDNMYKDDIKDLLD